MLTIKFPFHFDLVGRHLKTIVIGCVAHSPDNSFMGFVVERHMETPTFFASNGSSLGDGVRKNQAVVYGKAESMWSVRSRRCTCVRSFVE